MALKSPASRDGVPIVLTASNIEMSDFKLNPFIAFLGGFPQLFFPKWFLKRKLFPPVESDENGAAKFAPYGLRKIEAILSAKFGSENVVTVHPNNLAKFVGKNTKVVGITSMDPLGIGFVSRTYTSILGFGAAEPLVSMEFNALLNHPVLKKYRPAIVVGGAGAWQIRKLNSHEQLGIDVTVIGEAELVVGGVFEKIMNDGYDLPNFVDGERPTIEQIPLICKPALYGTVEITRGCGRGCQFCSPTMRNRLSFPLERILAEARLNASAGSKMILLQTDDIFLYKTHPNFMPNRDAIFKLIDSIAKIPNVAYIQIAHAALPPVVAEPKLLEEIGPILVEKGRWTYKWKKRFTAPEIGIETGSVRLLEKYMKGKPLPYKCEDWPQLVPQAIGIMNDNSIYPLATLVAGLPGETEEDTIATLELVDKLKTHKVFFVPLLFTAEEDCLLRKAKHAQLKNVSSLQWQFIGNCWKHNIDVFGTDGLKVQIMFFSIPLMPLFRFKHGRNITYSMLTFTNWADTFIGRYIVHACEPKLCKPR